MHCFHLLFPLWNEELFSIFFFSFIFLFLCCYFSKIYLYVRNICTAFAIAFQSLLLMLAGAVHPSSCNRTNVFTILISFASHTILTWNKINWITIIPITSLLVLTVFPVFVCAWARKHSLLNMLTLPLFPCNACVENIYYRYRSNASNAQHIKRHTKRKRTSRARAKVREQKS